MGYTGQRTKVTFREYLEILKRGSGFDAGYFYCPYIPLMSCGNVVAGKMSSSIITRYGPIVDGKSDV